jgi:hypothetical protein
MWNWWRLNVVLVLCIAAVFATLSWFPSGFVKVGALGAGELFEAYHGAWNLERFGWRWAGLQDMATNSAAESHPFLYLHHANFGLYVSYAMRLVGIRSIEAQNLVSGAGSALGFIVAFQLTWRISRSYLLATVLFVLLALDLYYLSTWAFNLHRAFSYVSVLATMWAFVGLVENRLKSVGWALLLILGCVLLIGADYVFFIFTFIALALYAVLIIRHEWRTTVANLGILVFCFGFAFLFRQLQVIFGAGFELWASDFLFQILNRTHREDLFQGDWSQVTTTFYSQNSILNPGFAPRVGWGERMYHFLSDTGTAYWRDVIGLDVPTNVALLSGGFLTLGLLVLLAIPIMVRSGYATVAKRSACVVSLIAATVTVVSIGYASVVNSASVGWLCVIIAAAIAIVLIGLLVQLSRTRLTCVDTVEPGLVGWAAVFLFACIAMYALVPTYFVLWYPAFLLAPLCSVLWVTALVCPLLATYDTHARSWLVAALVALKVVSIAPALFAQRTNEGDHAPALRALAGQPTASNFTPASVASYTRAFSGWVKPAAVEKLLRTGSIEPSDYFMLFERDRAANDLYRKPSYFIYFRALGSPEQLAELGKFSPTSAGDTFILFKVP